VASAVVAVHYQNDVVHPDGKLRAGLARDEERRGALVANARRLLEGARGRGVPVVSVAVEFPAGHAGVVQNSAMFRGAVESGALVEGSWGAAFHDELSPVAGEPVVRHERINGFYGSELDGVLAQLGADSLIVCGVATHSAVEHTARHAADAGYHVTVASDACAAADDGLHAASLRSLALHVERVATVDEILAAL